MKNNTNDQEVINAKFYSNIIEDINDAVSDMERAVKNAPDISDENKRKNIDALECHYLFMYAVIREAEANYKSTLAKKLENFYGMQFENSASFLEENTKIIISGMECKNPLQEKNKKIFEKITECIKALQLLNRKAGCGMYLKLNAILKKYWNVNMCENPLDGNFDDDIKCFTLYGENGNVILEENKCEGEKAC